MTSVHGAGPGHARWGMPELARFRVVSGIGGSSRVLGFSANGTTSPTIPVLMFAIMFGLSMDLAPRP